MDEFGRFAIVWLVATLVLAANRAVFLEQFLVKGRTVEGYSEALSLVVGGVLLVSAAALSVGWIGLGVAGITGSLFVLTDSLRYAATAAASSVDRRKIVVAEVLRVALVAGAWVCAILAVPVPVVATLLVSGSSVWGVVWRRRLRAPSSCVLRSFLGGLGAYEAYMASQYVLLVGLGQLVPYSGVAILGPGPFGSLRLAQSLVMPIAIVSSALFPVMIRYWSTAGRGLVQKLVGWVLVSVAAASIVGLIAWKLMHHFAEEILPSSQVDDVRGLLLPVTVAAALTLISVPGSALVRAMRWGRLSLLGQIGGTAVTVAAVAVALNRGAMSNFAWAISFGAIATVATTVALVLMSLLREPRR